MILEMDAGNTRIKWRLREQDGKGWHKLAEDSVFAEQKVPSVFIELGKQLEKLPMSRVERMLVSTVRGEGFKTVFSSVMTEKWHLQPEYASVAPEACGVRNGYDEPGKLGVDRWLAVVAAYAQTRAACCIVDCGTTITVDFVEQDGRHKGGFIVPGLHLMRDALAARSKALSTVPGAWEHAGPGSSTIAAVHNGILAMALGFLRDIHQQDRQAGRAVQWYLTGGDAPWLEPHLDWQTRVLPDLVMDGLSLTMLG
ncbi:MAG TPA: type III pantothenate kinase [Pseudomonadales bacterium]